MVLQITNVKAKPRDERADNDQMNSGEEQYADVHEKWFT